MNKSTQYIVDSYEIDCPDEEAAVIEDIMKMNGGSDKAIIIENLRGWFTAKTPADKLVATVYKDMLVDVDWDKVYAELRLDVFGRK